MVWQTEEGVMDRVNLAVGREHERLAFQETQEISETRKDSQKERLERNPSLHWSWRTWLHQQQMVLDEQNPRNDK